MKTLKKSLALLLALVMCLGCMSLPAFADGEEPVTFEVTKVRGDNIGLVLAICEISDTGSRALQKNDTLKIGTGDSSAKLALAFARASKLTQDASWESSSAALEFGAQQTITFDGSSLKFYPVSLSGAVTGPITITGTLTLGGASYTASVTLKKTVSIPSNAIAYVGELENESFIYESGLQAALAAANENTTITLVKDVPLTENFDGKNVPIQMNGCKFTVNSDVTLSNLVLQMNGGSVCAIEATHGEVVLENVRIIGSASQHALVINGAEVTINGEDTSIEVPAPYTIDVSADSDKVSKLTINAGTFSSIGDDISITGSRGRAEITVNGGEIGQIEARYTGDIVTITGGVLGSVNAHTDNTDTKLTVSGGLVGNWTDEGNESLNGLWLFTDKTLTGGYFKIDPSNYVKTPYQAIALTEGDEYYAKGYRWKVQLDPGQAVAQIGTGDNAVLYPTLAEAIAAAESGDTITLLANAPLDSTVNIDKSLTLNLNSNNISATNFRALWVKSGDVEITGDGTISANKEGESSFSAGSSVIRVGDSAANVAQAKLTVGSGVTVSSNHCYGISVFGMNANDASGYGEYLTVNGAVSGGAGAIASNGTGSLTNPNITVNEGAAITSGGVGIYLPAGKLTVNGGSITGDTAVYFKSTDIEIKGGTLTGTGSHSNYQFNGNGCDCTGDALVIDNCNYPKGIGTISVTGGTFTSQHASPVGSYAGNGQDEPLTGFITGGTFSTDPSNAFIGDEASVSYVATGYCAVKSNEDGTLNPEGTYWTVVKAYTVKFVNWDGKLLQSGFVARGAVPTYSGTPTRTADASNTYTFTGWSPAVVPATGNATYMATYDATPVASNDKVTVTATTNETTGEKTVTVEDKTDASKTVTTETVTNETTVEVLELKNETETSTVTTATTGDSATASATAEKTVKAASSSGTDKDATYTYTVKTYVAEVSNAASAEAAKTDVAEALNTKIEENNAETSTTVTLKAQSTDAAADTSKVSDKNATLENKLTTDANAAAKNVITTDKVSDATLSKKMTDLATEEEITGKAVTVDVTLTLDTKLTDYKVESGAATTVTYDVKPVLTTVVKIDGVQQGEAVSEVVRNEDLTATEAEPITVKLPIPATFGTSGTLQIKHLDDSGNLKGYILGTIEGNSTNGYYVEFTVTEFSSFEIVPAGKVFVTFDANGGDAVAGKTVTKNAAIGDLPAATRSGSYRFDGWFTAQTGGTQISAATTVSVSTTYFAHWTYTGGSGSYSGGSNNSTTTTITDEETPLSAFPIFYVDVAEDSWYHDAVAYVTALDLMNGVGDDRFDPNANTTRGMVAVVMMRLAQGVAIDSESFFDVADDAYYAEAAAWAVENGVYVGFDDGSFRGELNILREQFAAVLYRYATAKGYDVSGKAELGSFTDSASVSGYAADAMAWAVESGIIEGVGDNLLDPLGNATRAQLATMLMRFHALYTAEV